jgi:hypothetical protein
VETGSLQDANIAVTIDGIPLASEGSVVNVPIGRTYIWYLTMSTTTNNDNNDNAAGFRGFLVRLEDMAANEEEDDSRDTTEALFPRRGFGGTAKMATVCQEEYNVGGVTHTSRARTTEVTGNLFLDFASDHLQLDVTVVLQNRRRLSQFYYSSFRLVGVMGGEIEQAITNTTTSATEEVEEVEEDAETIDVDAEETETPTEEAEEDNVMSIATMEPTTTASNALSASATASNFTLSPTDASTTMTTSIVEATMVPSQEMDSTTDEATAAPTTVDAGSNIDPPLIPLVNVESCSPENPCGACMGDCNTNDDCQEGLECFRRSGEDTGPVPGCAMEQGNIPGTDYCYTPADDILQLRTPPCTIDNPCDTCQGVRNVQSVDQTIDSEESCFCSSRCQVRWCWFLWSAIFLLSQLRCNWIHLS